MTSHMITNTHIRPIETERLVLRAMTYDDAADVLAFAGDHDTAYWAGMEPLDDLADARAMIDLGNCIPDEPQYAITLKDTGKVIGAIEISHSEDIHDNIHPTLGYILSPEVTRRGYMSEAVNAVCDDLFRNHRVDRIMCEIRKDNIPSRGVALKCGFVQNAYQNRWRLNHYGKPLDEFFLDRVPCPFDEPEPLT